MTNEKGKRANQRRALQALAMMVKRILVSSVDS
jgi:hypothetical protein